MIKLDRRKCVDLKPYENNARINDKAIDAVANSIRDFGMNNPILIDENNVVVAGHARLKALEKLHIEETPVLVLSDLSEDKIKAFRIADNSTAQLAEWDLQKLQAALDSFDIEMEQYGLQEQLDKIQQQIDADMAADLEEDEVPEPDEINQPITEEGDIWKLGRHFLMCGDCTKEEHVKKLLNETKIDLFVTDPPYNVDYEGKTKEALTISNDDMDEEEYHRMTNLDTGDRLTSELVIVTSGSYVRKEYVTAWFVMLRDVYKINFLKIGYDRALAKEWLTDMQENGFSIEKTERDKETGTIKRDFGILTEVAQGGWTLSEPMKIIKSLFESGKIVADIRNKLFPYCFYNLKVRQDVNNNLSPHKAKSTGHIDGAIGVFNGFVGYQRAKPLYQYDLKDLFVI